MAQGTIKRLTDRGFGFIDQGTGQDLFFHSSALQNVTFNDLRQGDRVEFTVEPDPRGRGDRAVDVRRIQR
jgi:CspA family cold shock protein